MMLVDTIARKFDSSLCPPAYYVPNGMLKSIRSFKTLYIIESSRHEHINVHIKQVFRKTLQNRPIRIKTGNLMERNHERAPHYVKAEIDGKLRRKYERSAKLGRLGHTWYLNSLRLQ